MKSTVAFCYSGDSDVVSDAFLQFGLVYSPPTAELSLPIRLLSHQPSPLRPHVPAI